MKKKICLLLFTALSVCVAHTDTDREISRSVQSLARDLVAAYRTLAEAKYRNRIAVLDFEETSQFSRSNRLGFAFSEILAEYLVDYVEDFRMIERKQLDKILKEQELALSGALGDAEVKNIGKLSGADLLVLGSVFEIGDTVQVNVRLVEVERGDVLLSKRIDLSRELFMAEARQYIKVANSLFAGYRFQYIDQFLVHDLVVAYNYNFFKGLALGFELFYGFSDTRLLRINKVDNAGVIDFDEVEKSFQQLGLNILFSAEPLATARFSLVLALDPSILAYLDKNVLVTHYFNNTDYETGDPVVRSNYVMFEGIATAAAAIQVARSWRIEIGASYQLFPLAEEVKEMDWEDIGAATSGTVVFNDDIKMSSFSGWLGMVYRF